MKRLVLILLIVLSCCVLVFSQAQGKNMYVAVKSAELKSSAGSLSNTLATLELGSTVTVIQENGKWSEVRTEKSLSGWVASASLSARRITGQGRSASAGEIALAGKGFSAEVEMEYRKSGLDYSAVDSMEKLTTPREDLIKFINDGHLSRGE